MRSSLHLVSLLAISSAGPAFGQALADLEHRPAVWAPREFSIPTAAAAPGGLAETSPSPSNPWLDWRLIGLFVGPSGQLRIVPGFYAADAVGGDRGSFWKLRFSPDQAGAWMLVVVFEQGRNLNVEPNTTRGTAVFPTGAILRFLVGPADKSAPGFLAHGPLEAVGEHYLRFRDGTWFLKGGTNSPENLLGYAGFDGARDLGGVPRGGPFLHRYAGHAAHWRAGDPDWASGGAAHAGRGIIGALNYLARESVNSVYFLPMNLGGDGQDTFPFVDPSGSSFDAVTHYDVGRLEQWNRVFEHAQRNGIQLGFVLAEQESQNVRWLGRGLTIQRRLYLKTLVSMFGHHPGIKWILCEENSAEPTDEFSIQELTSFAEYIRSWAMFDHPISVHTDPDDHSLYGQILASPAHQWLTATSLQLHSNYNPQVEAVRQLFAGRGRKIVVDQDEQGSPAEGLTATNHDDRRKLILWDVYLSGGNLEWYLGYHNLPLGGDLQTEDFSTRREMWRFMRYARQLVESFPFWRMQPNDDLVTGETRHPRYGDAEVFAEPGVCYIVYYADATATGTLDLRAASSSDRFELRWFDPRQGRYAGAPWTVAGGGHVNLPPPPATPREDWVLTAR